MTADEDVNDDTESGAEGRAPREALPGVRSLVRRILARGRAWVRRPRRRATTRLLVALTLFSLLSPLAFLATLHHELDGHAPSHLVLDRHGAYLAEFPAADGELGYWPLPDVLPDKLVTATLEIEDRAFYRHPGVRLGSLLRAAWQNLAARRVVSGASTVAMQLARLQSPGPRNLWRKAREAAEALWLVHAHGHDRVLRQYLTLAPYGNNVRGAARAARLYFGKPVEDLSWLEAAFLASLPQAPALMNPYDPAGHRRARARAERILRVLHERHLISDLELAQSLGGTLTLVPRPHRSPFALHAALAWQSEATQRGPISTTTLDLGLQELTARLVDENLRRLFGSNADNTAALVVALPGLPGTGGARAWGASDAAADAAESGAVGGDILAYVGSRDYGAEDAKGAIDYLVTKRSPGSALKPFIYGLALAGQGRARSPSTTATVLADTPTQIPLGFSQQWFPENFDRTFEGPVLLRHALGNSRNVPALEILARVGVDETLQLLDRAGVRGISYAPGRYGLALAIGALPVTALEMARLYGVVATGGHAFPLRKFVDERPAAGAPLLSRESAALLADVLADPLARRPAFPAGGPLDFPYAVAVKTGTSQGHRDAWAVGFSDRVLVAVWVGNHDGRRMDRVTGASGAGPAFHAILDAATAAVAPHLPPAAAFPLPPGVRRETVCSLSGELAGPHCPTAHQEMFIRGTEPTALCPFHHEVALDRRNHLRASPQCPPRFVERRVMLDLPAAYGAWARERHLDVAPLTSSPLCGAGAPDDVVRVSVTEPRPGTRLLYDPDAAPDSAGVKLEADVEPPGEDVVWEIDGVPVARTGPPYVARQTLALGRHSVVARLARRSEASRPVIVDVIN